MPQIAQGPGNPLVTPYLFTVPFPAAAGTAGPSIPVGTFLSAGSQVRQGPAIGDYSDAWIELINYSDSMLSMKWDQGPMEPFIPPGHIWSARIPVSATTLYTTIAMQTPTQFFSNEVLAVTFYTDHDIRSGYRPRIGPLVPSVPAAAIGPGPLPEGVTIGADDVTAETFGAGVLLPGSQVTGDVAATQIGPGPLDTDVTMTTGSIQPSGTLNCADRINVNGLPINGEPAGSINLQAQPGVGGPGTADLHLFSNAAGDLYLKTRSAGTGFVYFGATGAGSFPNWVRATGQFSLDGGAFTSDGSGNLTANTLASLGGQATVGSFGAPPFVAQAVGVTVTVTTLQTILTYTPAVSGRYRVSGSFYMGNSANELITFGLTLTQLNGGGIGGQHFILPGGTTSLDGSATTVGHGLEWSIVAYIYSAANTGPITVTYRDPAGTPNDVVNVFIERVA